jgi:EAL domain-containing protein (putative c-di-GMP-specific phosphodiesterase class I)
LNLNFLPQSLCTSSASILTTMEAARQNDLPIELIVVEVTENEVIGDHARFTELINGYRALGVKVAIDDFGAGYSGLNLLANFQPDQIKLDMTLVRGIESHGPRQAIVRAVDQVCCDLGIDVIAEGVETIEEYLWLENQGIKLFQGYLFAKPAFECLPLAHYPNNPLNSAAPQIGGSPFRQQ